jgi:putative transposase
MTTKMIIEHKVSIRQACRTVQLNRSTFSYTPEPKDDTPIINALKDLVEKHPSIGFWQSFYRIRKQGYMWNHKAVYRVYTQMGLSIRRRAKKRLPARVKQTLFQPSEINQVWSLDFMTDSLWDGRSYRLLNVIDDYNREVLGMEVDTSLPALRVIRLLEHLKETRGLPSMLRTDNGPEFISSKLDLWCKQNKITMVFIQPGKPTQNAFVERCNGNIRRELLNAYVFKTLGEVRTLAEQWRQDYNNKRPHAALNYKTPMEILSPTK